MVVPEGISFRNARFETADFRNANFGRVDFQGVKIDVGRFDYAKFGGANFVDAEFEEGYFTSAQFGEAGFLGTEFKVGHFADAHFEWGNFAGAEFERGSFEDAGFKRGSFSRTRFGEANFVDAEFEEGGFRFTHFEKAFFYGAKIGNADFFQAQFGKADFQNLKFGRADFFGAQFREASFANVTRLQSKVPAYVRFKNCTFRRALFSGPDEDHLSFADFEVDFTDVRQVEENSLHFSYVDFTQWRFLRTDLRNAEFTGVKWCDDVPLARVGLYEEVAEKSGRGKDWVDSNPNDEEESRPWFEIESLYRQLKLNYEQNGDYPRAGDFHIGQKEARRKNPSIELGPWLLLCAYRVLSRYGERALPAALGLLVLVIVFATGYLATNATIPPEAAAGPVRLSSFSSLQDWGEALVISAEATLFPVRSAGFDAIAPRALNLAQRVVSPVFLALLALAIRQRVKR
jgi:uncharacterized protein YjbI with pentapeptide repeats